MRFVLAIAYASIPLAAHAADPRIPPGKDPGGVAVALVADGVDYLKPEIAARLARDGEGEIIGYDFVDDNRTPFAADGTGMDAARALVSAAPSVRLAPVRAAPGTANALARSLAFVARSPARIAVLVGVADGEGDFALLRKAAEKLSNVLFVVSGGDENANGGAEGVANVIVVGGGEADAAPKAASIPAPPSNPATAAAAIAARAVDVANREPGLDGAGLKRKVMEPEQPR